MYPSRHQLLLVRQLIYKWDHLTQRCSGGCGNGTLLEGVWKDCRRS